MKKKKGFTLSEVLITLGIIGVVAAITMPTLMTKIQEKQYQSQYKKIFSELNQAVRLLQGDEENLLSDCGSFQDACFRNAIASKLKVAYTCDSQVPNKCQKNSTFLGKQTRYYKMNVNDTWPALTTISGYSVKFRFHRANCSLVADTADTAWAGNLINCGWVQVDTNGISRPNVVGKDIFFLSLMQDGFVPYYETNDKIKDCKKGTGISCSSLYINNGGIHFSH